MKDKDRATANGQWTSVQAYVFAAICLMVGIAGGWFIRGSQTPVAAAAATTNTSAPAMGNPGAADTPTPGQMQRMADTQAGPLLDKLKADPNNAGLLASIGNVYYDAHLFPSAIDYYQRSLKSEPTNTGVRTDLGTAYWYSGNVDEAISEFQKSLSYEPNKPNTLFNLGIVQWQGKMDIDNALATWKKLLETNPNYEGKDKVLELMAQVKKHSNLKPGTRVQ